MPNNMSYNRHPSDASSREEERYRPYEWREEEEEGRVNGSYRRDSGRDEERPAYRREYGSDEDEYRNRDYNDDRSYGNHDSRDYERHASPGAHNNDARNGYDSPPHPCNGYGNPPYASQHNNYSNHECDQAYDYDSPPHPRNGYGNPPYASNDNYSSREHDQAYDYDRSPHQNGSYDYPHSPPRNNYSNDNYDDSPGRNGYGSGNYDESPAMRNGYSRSSSSFECGSEQNGYVEEDDDSRRQPSRNRWTQASAREATNEREEDPSPPGVPLRIEVAKKDGSRERFIEEYRIALREEFRHASRYSKVSIEEDSDIREVPVERMNYSRWIYSLKVSSKNWRRDLLPLARQYLANIKYHPHLIPPVDPFDMPVIYAHSNLYFPLRLCNQHQKLPVKSISFGSMINNGLHAIHWIVEDRNNIEEEIDASLEYDRRAIEVEFLNREPRTGPQFQGNNGDALTLYKIKTTMEAISRIMFDQSNKGPNGYYRGSRLILLMDHPPKIQSKQKAPDLPNGRRAPGREWSLFDYRLDIRRGRTRNEQSDPQALHESKLIIIEFDEERLERSDLVGGDLDGFYYEMLARLRHKTSKAIEFVCHKEELRLQGYLENPENGDVRFQFADDGEADFDKVVLTMLKRAAQRLCGARDFGDNLKLAHRVDLKVFRVRSYLEGILQRGMDVRCQLRSNRGDWIEFVSCVAHRYLVDEQGCLAILERMLKVLSEGRPNCLVIDLFNAEVAACTQQGVRLTSFTRQEKAKGYTRLAKLVITPTRQIYVGDETIMANRVLKKHNENGTKIIRASFRDDSGDLMRCAATGKQVLEKRMREVLHNGITFAGNLFFFLGNSNSQLRDHGAYFYNIGPANMNPATLEIRKRRIIEVRQGLGKFQLLKSIPKILARMGQCFTQAVQSDAPLSAEEVGMLRDLIGGWKASAKEPYVFSDGVGVISHSHALEIAEKNGLDFVPSAFQIRHQGQKGLISVDPSVDERNELLDRIREELPGTVVEPNKKFLARPSMDKFEVHDDVIDPDPKKVPKTFLELVKYAQPSPLFLNRPLLNILSQVSEHQSAECHRRVVDRLEDLLDDQLRRIIQSMYVEKEAQETIRELPTPIHMELIRRYSHSIKLTTEPYFRGLLRAQARFVLQKQLQKMQIRIPTDLGRSMFGVVDTSGLLQYGQVFCSCTRNTSREVSRAELRRAKRKKNKLCQRQPGATIITGRVLVTKNPCTVAGDVRMFEAVDIPALRHLVDVVVFPQHGPRPHPDEMAGSDLDGDEYTIIWDTDLFFDHNESAMHYPAGAASNHPVPMLPNGEADWPKMGELMAEFYIKTMTVENVGVLANAHLATSDQIGLFAPTCDSIALKYSQALDFQKNGVMPAMLTTGETEDPKRPGFIIPPEKPMRKPLFMEKHRDPAYVSSSVLGRIHEEVVRYQKALRYGEAQIEEITIDPAINVEGWEKYKSKIRNEMEEYHQGIKMVMEHYGIQSESELISGAIINIKNRISDKESDDMCMYNTHQVIEEKLMMEQAEAREKFFTSFGRWEDILDQCEYRRQKTKDECVLDYFARHPTTTMRQKAVCAYRMAYESANQALRDGDSSSVLISFPWLFYDVLLDVLERPDDRIVGRVTDADEKARDSDSPLANSLTKFAASYCSSSDEMKESFASFVDKYTDGEGIVARLLKEYKNLSEICFVVVQWAKSSQIFDPSTAPEGIRPMREEHLVALFISYGLGEMKNSRCRRPFLRMPSGEQRELFDGGKLLLTFFDFTTSSQFKRLKQVSFGQVSPALLVRGEWKTLITAAVPAYLSLVVNHQFDNLMNDRSTRETDVNRLREMEPRVMELPAAIIRNEPVLYVLAHALQQLSGCTEVQLRQHGSSTKVLVSAIGSEASFTRLLTHIVPPMPSREAMFKPKARDIFPDLVFTRLVTAATEKLPGFATELAQAQSVQDTTPSNGRNARHTPRRAQPRRRN